MVRETWLQLMCCAFPNVCVPNFELENLQSKWLELVGGWLRVVGGQVEWVGRVRSARQKMI